MKQLVVLLLLAGVASAAADETWVPLSGEDIRVALTDRKLTYNSAWQEFHASGRTLYNAGHDSWGYWQVRGDQYCSMWPPSDLWACYDMSGSGERLIFIDGSGHVTEGAYARE